MAYNIFNDSISTSGDIELGKRLTNIKNLNISQPRFSVYDSNNAVTTYAFNPGIASILNQASLDALKTTLLENTEEAIVFKSDSNNQILFHTGLNSGIPDASNLRLEITDTNTKINNNLLVDTIKRKSDNTDAISLGPTTMTLQKPMTIFRDSTNYGYMRIQNSVNTKSGYLDWMTGAGLRVAYMGLGENNNGITKINNSLTLGLENQCNFSINDDTTTIFKVSLEDDTIDLNYTTNANGNFIMKDDNAHKEINNNNNLPLLKLASGQNYSANLYGEDANNGLILSKTALLFKLDAKVASADVDLYISKIQTDTLTANTSVSTPKIVTQILQSKQGDDEILLQNNGGTHSIRLIPGATNFIQSTSNTLSFTKFSNSVEQIIIDHNNLAPHNTGTLISKYNVSIRPPTGNLNFNLFKCPSNEQVSLYSHSSTDGGFVIQKAANDDGIKINMFHDGSYKPIYLNSANSSQLVVGSEVVQTETERFVVVSSSRFKNGLTSDADIDLVGTSKIHFSSNNYFANDATHNLNLFLNNNKNFVVNSGNDQSKYQFKINGQMVLEMTRDLTSNPAVPDNKTQISSQTLLLEDDGVLGGTLELVRTGASTVYTGYINYNNFLGRVFYTGFNTDSVTLGQPIHYMEDVCRSYTFKNSLGNIMKIISHSGTIGADTDYVQIGNRLESPVIRMYDATYVDGTQPNNDDGLNEINGRNSSTSDVGHMRISAGGGSTPSTSKTSIDLYGSATDTNRSIKFKVGDQLMLNITNNEIRCGNAIVPDGGVLNIGKTSNKWANVYTDNLNTNTGIFNTNLQTPSLISSSNTSTYQSRLDMDDLLATFVCRDVAGVEKSILIGSYSALVSNVQITANQGILMNNTFNSRNITPTSDDTYNIGSLSQRYNDIYATNNLIQTSDINMKKDIQPIQNGLKTIMKLKPVSYKFKDGTRIHTGYIAQHCKDTYVKDWAGYIENEGHFGLRYTEFISLNTQAIQELYRIIQNKQGTPFDNNGVGEHKCPGVYNLEQDIEQLCQSKDALEQELFKFKTQNDILEQRIIELENIDYRQQPVEPTSVGNNDELVLLKNRIDILEERDMLADSDATQTSQLDIIMSRLNLLENENKKLKVKVAKQTTIINKILTSK